MMLGWSPDEIEREIRNWPPALNFTFTTNGGSCSAEEGQVVCSLPTQIAATKEVLSKVQWSRTRDDEDVICQIRKSRAGIVDSGHWFFRQA